MAPLPKPEQVELGDLASSRQEVEEMYIEDEAVRQTCRK
jgi:hypothetical protein